MLERGVGNAIEVLFGTNPPNIRVMAIETGKLALAARANQAGSQRLFQSDTRMLEGSPLNADAYCWHFLLLAPSHGLFVVVSAVEVHRV